jgi:hypothetical protein
MGYLFGQKRRKVGRLQRQAARCFLVTQEADSVELGTWCWPRVVLIEKRPLTECERSSMNRACRQWSRNTRYQAGAAASYADRILKGATPSELPVQAPLGLDVPWILQQRADEVALAVLRLITSSYLTGRTSTGWIAPACLAHSLDHRRKLSTSSLP